MYESRETLSIRSTNNTAIKRAKLFEMDIYTKYIKYNAHCKACGRLSHFQNHRILYCISIRLYQQKEKITVL